MERSVVDSPRIERAFKFSCMKFSFHIVNPKYYVASPDFQAHV